MIPTHPRIHPQHLLTGGQMLRTVNKEEGADGRRVKGELSGVKKLLKTCSRPARGKFP